MHDLSKHLGGSALIAALLVATSPAWAALGDGVELGTAGDSATIQGDCGDAFTCDAVDVNLPNDGPDDDDCPLAETAGSGIGLDGDSGMMVLEAAQECVSEQAQPREVGHRRFRPPGSAHRRSGGDGSPLQRSRVHEGRSPP